MYRKLVVPLDGSEFAECGLAHAKAIASGCQVPEVVLLRVVEPLSADTVSALAMARDDSLRQVELYNQAEAKKYLAKVGDDLRKEGIAASVVTIDGRPEDEILKYAENNGVDLIVMTTHGKTGVSRWFFGSVADKVVRHSTIPVMTIAPPGCRTFA